jgi:hypothetical protein
MLVLKVACVIRCLNYGRRKLNMFSFFVAAIGFACHMWSDNKVHELATVCVPWQHWTKALV